MLQLVQFLQLWLLFTNIYSFSIDIYSYYSYRLNQLLLTFTAVTALNL
jgi:hypothetical protein